MNLDKLEQHLEERIPGLLDATGRFAVLVPLVRREDGLHLLYEVRAKGIAQPGEVCFPGGKMEPGEDPETCALRETWEELGIPASKIRVLGHLDFLAHRSGLIMYPVLGVLEGETADRLRFSPSEVAETFQVPLEYLRKVQPLEYTYALETRPPEDFPYEELGITPDYNWRSGRERGVSYPWEGHAIWGLTGKITRHLLELLKEMEF